MKQHKFTVVVYKDESGAFIVECPALQGCHTHGRTKREALANIREAIELHLEVRRDRGEPIPEEVGCTTMRVAG